MSAQKVQPQHQHAVPSGEVAGSPVRVTCPACGQAIHVIPVVPTATVPTPGVKASQSSQSSALFLLGKLAYDQLRGWRNAPSLSVESEQEVASEPQARRPIWAVIGLIALMLLLGGVAIWWSWAAHLPASSAEARTPVVDVGRTHSENEAVRAAIIATLSGYNRAETEAAALLNIEPLLPFIDPTSSFASQRAAHLAERRQQNAPHRTMLVRWAIGNIRVEGKTALVVTQETWSNQEAGAVAAELATVRVTYTLRQDASTGKWLIVQSSQQPL